MAAQGLDWTVPLYGDDSSTYLIRAYSPIDRSLSDDSDRPFSIVGSVPRPRLTVRSPNGGELLLAGWSYPILWTAENPAGDVSIELCEGSSNCRGIATVPMATGRFTWDICPTIEERDDYRLRLSWSADGYYVEDYSNGAFEIFSKAEQSISITAPQAGLAWEAGTTQKITWVADTEDGDVDIELYQGGQRRFTIAWNVPVRDGSYDWAISPYLGDGTDYSIHLNWWPGCEASVDIAGGDFAITGSRPSPTLTLTQPNGGEVWQAGTTNRITWEATNAVGEASVWLMKRFDWGWDYFEYLGTLPVGDEQFDWNICTYHENGEYKIRLDWCDPWICVSDESDAAFTITDSARPIITVIEPSGGAVWVAGTTQTIRWTSTTSDGDVEVRVAMGSGEWFYIDYVPVADGSVAWHIWPYIGNGNDYTIHLTWWPECGPSLEAVSEPFEITGSLPRPILTLTNPNGGEMVQAGSERLITWVATNPVGDVSLWLTKGGDGVADLGSSAMSAGQLSWQVCPYLQAGSGYRMHFRWCDGPICVSDESDELFEITGGAPLPEFVITNPTASTVWEECAPATITWTSTATTGTVEIYLWNDDWCRTTLGSAPAADKAFQLDRVRFCYSPGTDHHVEIRLAHAGCPTVQAISDNFEIAPASAVPQEIVITEPTATTVWQAGMTETIRWTSTISDGHVGIWLESDHDERFWIGEVPIAAGQRDWLVCPYVGDGDAYTIRLEWWPDCGSTVGATSAPFGIAGSVATPTITITSPTAGDVWEECAPGIIRWESTATLGSLNLELWDESCSCGTYLGSVPVADSLFETSRVTAFDGFGSDYYVEATMDLEGCPGVSGRSGNFEIVPAPAPFGKITVTEPTAATAWAAGTCQTVRWTSTSSDGYVEVKLVSGSGEELDLGNVPVSDGLVGWHIWPYIGDGTDYTIHLLWWPECGPSLEAVSERFEITASPPRPILTLTNPNGDEMIQAGSERLITWATTNPVGDVSLWLTKGGEWVADLGSTAMSAGQLSWQVCPYLQEGSDYRAHIRWCDGPICVEDESETPFQITGSAPAPTITITSPTAGTAWEECAPATISWVTTKNTGSIDVRLGKQNWGIIEFIATVPVLQPSIAWQRVRAWPGPDSDNYVEACLNQGACPAICTRSGTFTILDAAGPPAEIAITEPTAATQWEAGSTQTIAWTSTTSEGYVEVGLVRSSGESFWIDWIDYVPVADRALAWSIPSCIGDATDYSIRLSWWPECGDGVEATSEPFAIGNSLPQPTLTLTSPNGGEPWDVRNPLAITWESTNTIGEVEAYLLSACGDQHSLGSAPMSAGQLRAEICPYIGNGENYRVQVRSCSCGPCVSDASDVPFDITGSLLPPTIKVTSPNGADLWQAGEVHTITWEATNPTGVVDVYLINRIAEGESWYWIGSTPMEDGRLAWEACPYLGDGSSYSVRIEFCTCGPCGSDESDAPFQIMGSSAPAITVVSPQDGEVWQAGVEHTITWEAANPWGSVDVYLISRNSEDGWWDWVGRAEMSSGQIAWECAYAADGDGANYWIELGSCDCGPCWSLESATAFEIRGSRPWPAIQGDLDDDGAIGLADHKKFAECLTGPSTPGVGVSWPECWCRLFDWEWNGSVDLRDFAAFQASFGAVGQP
ncbi:MAG: Ser-Thr-rich GPI-anchored membrane family protein [Planctomycetota bacterium]